VVIERGEVYWVDLGEPEGSRPAFSRPVVVVSDDLFNSSQLATVIAVAIAGSMSLADRPGNVRIPMGEAGLSRDSVVNVTSLVTLNKTDLNEKSGRLRPAIMEQVDHGLREVLGLVY
jgi:mRNA interferase MazF